MAAGIDPVADPRGARWEARLRMPVLVAAWLAIPTVLLYFSSLKGWWAALALTLAWAIWLVFVVEAAIMLSVVAEKRAWANGHAFGLAIIVATFPLLTSILEGLLAARALSSLQGVRILQVLYLAKAAKLIKSWMILRKSGRGPRNPAVITAAALVCATALVGIGDRIVSGDKHLTPFHGAWDVASDLTVTSLVAVLAAAALVTAVLARRRGARRGSAAP